jgi:hypothetical protein
MVISPYQKMQEYLMMRLHGHQSLSKNTRIPDDEVTWSSVLVVEKYKDT